MVFLFFLIFFANFVVFNWMPDMVNRTLKAAVPACRSERSSQGPQLVQLSALAGGADPGSCLSASSSSSRPFPAAPLGPMVPGTQLTQSSVRNRFSAAVRGGSRPAGGAPEWRAGTGGAGSRILGPVRQKATRSGAAISGPLRL